DTVEVVYGEKGFDPFHEGGFGVSYVVWMIFTAGIVSCAVWQTAVMRACAASSTDVVKKLYAWSSIGFLIRFMLPMFLGICALTFFWNEHGVREGLTDPIASMQAMPIFLGQILPVGVIGIIAAGMLAAFMSTHDSYLLCWASVLAHDVAGPLCGNKLSEKQRLALARIFIFLIGVFLLVWSLWYPIGQNLWDYMAITGAIYFTGSFSLLLFGLYWKRASRIGAYLSLAAGGFAVLGLYPIQSAINLGENFRDSQIATLSGFVKERINDDNGAIELFVGADIIGLFATTLALALMVVGSLLFPDKNPVKLSMGEDE
ncbi:MAG: SSS family solute:Na+ symporter, partial [Planctomycetota bacterium]